MAEQLKDAKLVLLGNSGVGKTSLVYRFVHKIYQNEQPSTVGAAFMTKKMEGVVVNGVKYGVKLQIWDTAGQERFRCMTPMYYRSAAAAILVYDITSEESFASVKSWVSELNQHTNGIVLAIAGQKADLEAQRQVRAETARQYAASIGAIWMETSALSNAGVEDLFTEIAVKLLSGSSPDLRDGHPALTNTAGTYGNANNNNPVTVNNQANPPSTGCC